MLALSPHHGLPHIYIRERFRGGRSGDDCAAAFTGASVYGGVYGFGAFSRSAVATASFCLCMPFSRFLCTIFRFLMISSGKDGADDSDDKWLMAIRRWRLIDFFDTNRPRYLSGHESDEMRDYFIYRHAF